MIDRRRVYRYEGRWLWIALAPGVIGAVFLVLRMAMDGVPVAATVAVAVGFAALFGTLVRATFRMSTLVDEWCLTVRGAFRSRVLTWPEVQGIEIRQNIDPGGGNAPTRVAVYYDEDGRRRDLPHLNDHSWPAFLDREVAAIRETWLRGRGDGWAAVPRVERRIARDHRHDMSPGLIAMVAAGFAFVLGTVLFVILLVTGAYGTNIGPKEFVDTYFHPFVLMLAAPVGVFVVALVTVALLRRREL